MDHSIQKHKSNYLLKTKKNDSGVNFVITEKPQNLYKPHEEIKTHTKQIHTTQFQSRCHTKYQRNWFCSNFRGNHKRPEKCQVYGTECLKCAKMEQKGQRMQMEK